MHVRTPDELLSRIHTDFLDQSWDLFIYLLVKRLCYMDLSLQYLQSFQNYATGTFGRFVVGLILTSRADATLAISGINTQKLKSNDY